jgi:hypothetical protein
MTRKIINQFWALPAVSLPGAVFVEDETFSGPGDDLDVSDAWVVLRRAAKTGESCTDLCGSAIRVRADRDGWRDGFVID